MKQQTKPQGTSLTNTTVQSPTVNENKKYNGWANYQTYCVMMWISSDRKSYKFWTFLAWFIDDVGKLARILRNSYVNSLVLDGVYADYTLNEVDWIEIAECVKAL